MLEISKRGFLGITSDNDDVYFSHLYGVVESVDEFSSVEITKAPEGLKFRIAPSLPKYTNMLLQEILKFHNMFGIRLELSKSIKTSSTISFEINIK